MKLLGTAKLSSKLLLSVGAVGVAAAVSNAGTFASFTGSTSVSSAPSSGTVVVGLGAVGSAANRLNVGATNIAPGDTIQRAVELANQGSIDFGSVSLTTNAPTTSLLDSDAVNGLQMTIDRCSVPWTESGTAPAYTYTCAGTVTSVVASRAVIGSNLALSNLGSLAAGQSNYLRVTLTLPTVAGNQFQGLSSTINYSFTAAQRTATSK